MIVRLVALALWLALLAAALAATQRPKPLMIDAHPAKVKLWVEVWSAPPQFCPAPMPVCHGPTCSKPTVTA